MNTRTRRRIIENIRRDSSETQSMRFDPNKPIPHIICPEARPHMERPASVWPPLLAGAVLGAVITLAALSYLS